MSIIDDISILKILYVFKRMDESSLCVMRKYNFIFNIN